MRVVKYKTKLSMDGKAVLEKEVGINYPAQERKLVSPRRDC